MTPHIDAHDLRAALGPIAGDGPSLRELADSILVPKWPALRLNPLGPAVPLSSIPFVGAAVPWYAGAAFWFALPAERTPDPVPRPAGHPLFAAGAYYVQDAASLLPISLLDPRPGERICDLCASPGGKATAILERLGDAGWLLANEPVRSRLPPLLLNLARHGGTHWAVTNLDPDALADALGPAFDAVLVDAPCTAQSLAAHERQPGRSFDTRAIQHNAARQARILAAAVRLLRPGGRLVYTTCTFSWAENEAQVTGLLEGFAGLRADPAAVLAAYADGPVPACYRLWPHRHGCAGGFAARVVAGDSTDRERTSPGAKPGRTRVPGARGLFAGSAESRARAPAFDRIPGEWGRWLRPVHVEALRDRAFAWPEGMPDGWRRIAVAGPEAAFVKGRTWFPAYALAMRRDGAFESHGRADVDIAGACRFLRGESFPGAERGWITIGYGGHALGWAKGDGRVFTNHLPKSARMLL